MIFEFIIKLVIACVLLPFSLADYWPVHVACGIIAPLVGALVASMMAGSVLIGALIGLGAGVVLALGISIVITISLL